MITIIRRGRGWVLGAMKMWVVSTSTQKPVSFHSDIVYRLGLKIAGHLPFISLLFLSLPFHITTYQRRLLLVCYNSNIMLSSNCSPKTCLLSLAFSLSSFLSLFSLTQHHTSPYLSPSLISVSLLSLCASVCLSLLLTHVMDPLRLVQHH